MEIAINFRTEDGKLRYGVATEKPVLAALEALLRKGQQAGDFRDFDLHVMAVTIRRAIDALPPLLIADPDLDVDGMRRNWRRFLTEQPERNESDDYLRDPWIRGGQS